VCAASPCRGEAGHKVPRGLVDPFGLACNEEYDKYVAWDPIPNREPLTVEKELLINMTISDHKSSPRGFLQYQHQ